MTYGDKFRAMDDDEPPIVWEHSDGQHTARLTVDPTGRVTLAIENDHGPLAQQIVVLDRTAVVALFRSAGEGLMHLAQTMREGRTA